jgi:flavin-dependent dehydrogenase
MTLTSSSSQQATPGHAIIVGAGPAGLACAASMSAAGVSHVIVEKENTVGSVWRRHYDRLHLHTGRGKPIQRALIDVPLVRVIKIRTVMQPPSA